MTYHYLPRAVLIDVCDTQRDKIATQARIIQELTADKRRLEEQIVTLMGKVQDARQLPDDVIDALRMVLVFSAPHTRNVELWHAYMETLTQWAAAHIAARQPIQEGT